ncbi:MAG: ABC transporter ATP-binding protein, partial [Spartobacteria bacterium]|nr:ABC transporter ATP-binding protein [Spartobacteria bacterium]
MLEVRAVTFAYRRGGEELFGGLSWSFAGGALTAVTGPSGRGKSTLLYLL